MNAKNRSEGPKECNIKNSVTHRANAETQAAKIKNTVSAPAAKGMCCATKNAVSCCK